MFAQLPACCCSTSLAHTVSIQPFTHTHAYKHTGVHMCSCASSASSIIVTLCSGQGTEGKVLGGGGGGRMHEGKKVLTHIGEIDQTASRQKQTEDKSYRRPSPAESGQGTTVATGTQTTNMLASCSLQVAQPSAATKCLQIRFGERVTYL